MGRKKKKSKSISAPPRSAGAAGPQAITAALSPTPVTEIARATEPSSYAQATAHHFQRTDWLWALLLVVTTIFAYQQAWQAGYIWDDDKYVTENQLLTAPDGLKRIWFSLDSPSQYFPLVYTTFRLEHALWGLHPSGYHWVNILLHAANALLVWRLLCVLKVPGAWLAAGLFALHPVQVESVAWITERKNVLMGFFFLLSLLCWTKFIDEESRARWKPYVLGLGFYALALFSKTTACTLPAALLLILWLKRRPINWARVAQITPFVVLGLAMGLVSIWWERHQQGTQGELFALGLVDRVLIASRAVWFYAGKLLWPVNLSFSYPRWEISAGDPLDYLWLLAVAGLAVAVFFARRYAGRSIEVALLFFVSTLSPMLGFIMLYTFRYTFVADHYQYLASVGPLALAAAGITTGFHFVERRQRLVRQIICGMVLAALGLLTWRQCRIYADEETLWRATIATNPGSWMAHNNLGIRLLRGGAVDEAIAHYNKALEIEPIYAEAHFNLGNALVRTGRHNEAVSHYEAALQLYPRFAAAHANLGALLLESGRLEEGVASLEKAVSLDPRSATAHQRLGEALIRLGRGPASIDHLKTSLQLGGNRAEAHNTLGRAFAQNGRMEEAIAEFQRALQNEPNSTAALNNLGNVLLQLGRVDEAMEHLRRAGQIDPRNAEAHYNLGNALLRAGRLEEAVASYRQAITVKPDYVRARNNLANTLVQLGHLEEAIGEYEKALETNPNYAAAHHNLGRALGRIGRTEEAEIHLQKAAELDAQLPRSN